MATKRLTAKQLRKLTESVISEVSPGKAGQIAATEDDIVVSLEQALKWSDRLSKTPGDSYARLSEQIYEALQYAKSLTGRHG